VSRIWVSTVGMIPVSFSAVNSILFSERRVHCAGHAAHG